MMNGFAFELKGNAAFFKKPDVNAQIYFTFNHIHKIALLGIFGSILGYGGYHQQDRDIRENGEQEENIFPEFYKKLRNLKISIIPRGDRGYFTKKIQVFNNSVGYASREKGRNLIVKEQWLENPHWTIHVLNDKSEVYRNLKRSLMEQQTVFSPYLGKNDHPAIIEDVKEVEYKETINPARINSLFKSNDVVLSKGFIGKSYFYYREKLPNALDEVLNSYQFEEMMYTSRKVKLIEKKGSVFLAEKDVLYFC